MLEIISVMAELIVPGLRGCHYFVHKRFIVNSLFMSSRQSFRDICSQSYLRGLVKFRCATAQKVLARCAFLLRAAEPAQRRPSLKPRLHFHGPFFRRDIAIAKRGLDRRAQGFSLAQSG